MTPKQSKDQATAVVALDARRVGELLVQGRALREQFESRIAPMKVPTEEQTKARVR